MAHSLPEKLTSASAEISLLEAMGDSAAMRRLRLQVQRIGPYFRTVLLRGEPGTEKELVARRLHELSPGAAGQFVACHAETLDDALEWLIGMARAGTLLLDDVEEMSPSAQTKLLRILRRHEIADGGIVQRPAIRVIASTGENLRVLACAGRFGQELYQRLATVEIVVPPLRERIEDVPALVKRMLDRLAGIDRSASVSDEAMERILHYRWPGNTGELENVLRSALLLADGAPIDLRHLPFLAEESGHSATNRQPESVRLQDVVDRHVLRVLKACGGNKLRAAERLGISRSTLYRMLDAGAMAHVLR